MAIFEYHGTDRSGTNVRATVDADSIKSAKQKIKKSGVLLLSIEEKALQKKKALFASFGGGNTVNLRTTAVMTRQFASLIKANIPLVEALAALIDQTDHPKLKTVLAEVRQQVNEGISLRAALAQHPKVFAPIFINMVEAGEASGTLPLVLLRLADFMESQVRLRSTIVSAMTYPLLMICLGGGLMLVIFTFVIPKIANIFVSMNKVLPWYTKLLMDMSFFIREYWWLMGIVAFAVSYFVKRHYSTPKGKVKKDRLFLKLPLFGPLVRMIAVSRFASTMATLLNGGVPIVNALGIVKSVVGNEILANAIATAKENNGNDANGHIPARVVHLQARGAGEFVLRDDGWLGKDHHRHGEL